MPNVIQVVSDNKIWDPHLLSQAHYSLYYTLIVLELIIGTMGKSMTLGSLA